MIPYHEHRKTMERPTTRRKPTSIAMAIVAGCLIYNLLSSSLDSIIPSVNVDDSNIDYDHYIPGHRFLKAMPEPIPEEDFHRFLKSLSSIPTTIDADEVDYKEYTRMLRASIEEEEFKKKLLPGMTLKVRSPEDARKIQQKAMEAARKRSMKTLDDAVVYSSMSEEVAKQVKEVARAIDIPPNRRANVTSYDIDSAILAVRAFHRELLFFVYDAKTDDFVVVHNLPTCEWGCKRAYIIAPVLAYALRKNYPFRFQGKESGDLVFLLSTGDMPRVRRPCLFPESKYCKSKNWAPILQFGSVLADPVYMPTAIAMPQSPRPHIPCIDEYQTTGKVCQDLQPRVMNAQSNAAAVGGSLDLKTGQHFQHGLVFGQELGLLDKPNYWDDLIPQVIWRGTDFMFLHTLFPDMRAPTYEEDIQPKEGSFGKDSVVQDAINALWEMGQDKLTPRWRGVLLTSEAELEASKTSTQPWLNIKFASYNVHGDKVPASQNQEYKLLQEKFGISAMGSSMNMMEHARYKYHIDLGGGGGTTWTGTIEKLALPGVLFHHVTPTKDWFHDHLEPWVHYIPIATDLSDLKEKYDWAESHPKEAQRIAEAGTEFARWMGSPEGYAQLYQEHIVAPLGNIIGAYKAPRKKYHGKRAVDILKEFSGNNFATVARCGGWPAESSECRWTRRDNAKAPNQLAAKE